MKTLEDIPAELAWDAQQAAQMRLQLYTVMRTHEWLGEFASTARGILMEAAGQDGILTDGLEAHLAIEGLTREWMASFKEWSALVEALRWNAAAIPYGTWAILHEDRFKGLNVETLERLNVETLDEAEKSPVFRPQHEAVLRASRERLYGDGFNLSSRIWKMDHESRQGIRRVVYEGIAKGDSAWNIAGRLEQYLGAGRECPRWSRSRLYKLTKKDIASGDRKGLYTGDECQGQGVSYNALRLARNEIQIAHQMASDANMAQMPWIQMEQVYLSPAHPETDICDDVVAGGENGDGIYPTGTISLPLHPQCLCGKRAVQMPDEEWTRRMRGWVRGEEPWAEMDQYHRTVGQGPHPGPPPEYQGRGAWPSLLVGIARRLAVWLWGDEPMMEAALAVLE